MTDPCFAIVFGLDDNYAKYASVSMMSIIYSINPTFMPHYLYHF